MRKSILIIPVLFLLAAIAAPAARADIYDITITNATFSATCVGELTTCTEVINGSADYNTVTGTVSNLSMMLSGTLSGTFALGNPPCSGSCFSGTQQIYIAATGFNPIEFSPSEQPCPSAPPGQGSTVSAPNLCNGNPNYETGFIVPTGCGGLANCGSVGTFPVGEYGVTSGTYTVVDLTTTPEPGILSLMLIGIGSLGLMVVMRRRKAQGLA